MLDVNKKTCVFIFCFIGCTVHLGYEVNHYLEFPVRSQVTIEFPGTMEIPDIDIHLPLIKVLDLNELFNRYPVELKSICKKLGRYSSKDDLDKDFRSRCLQLFETVAMQVYLTDLLTVGDIEQLTANSSSLISNVELHREFTDIPNGTVRPSCKIERHFSGMGLFLRVACRNGSQILSKTISTSSEKNQCLLCIHYKMKYSFGFRFVSHADVISSRYSKYQPVHERSGERVISISHLQRTIANSLEWPYQTNCRNYHKSRVLQDCLQSKLSNLTEPVIYSEFVSPFGHYPSHYKFVRPTNQINVKQAFEKCFQLIETQQCHSVWYKTINSVYVVKEDAHSVICLEPQTEYDVVFTSYPEITFSDLLIYSSSILGIWFGISVYGKLAADIDWFKIPVLSTPLFEKRNISIIAIKNEVKIKNEINYNPCE
uniref:Uncharacterized protein n=1 Tax=Tetranychus urticae TaxID=32264 RepID=T1JW48_TETUR